MKILGANAIREWDQFTIREEPISSINLMERAATGCFEWLESNRLLDRRFSIFCGKGNNGGDGLAIARLLAERKVTVIVYILEFGHKGTEDFQANLARLHQYPEVDIRFIQSETNFHTLDREEIIIDALFGSGLNRGIEGVTAALVEHINNSGATIISIDIPSGLFVDKSSIGNTIIKASHTLSFQCYKPAFLMAENAEFTGEVHILDIGLDQRFLDSVDDHEELIDLPMIQSIYQPRKPYTHKGNFGHALLVAGSYGKIGAAVLAANACLRSGVGLLTLHIPQCGYDILQSTTPEAMLMTDFNSSFITRIEDDLSRYKAIGIGPGIGTAVETKEMLASVFSSYQHPLVLDADALNCIATNTELLRTIPKNSILTPHPKEFERMFGAAKNDFDRLQSAINKSRELELVIVLKGHHTAIVTPIGKVYFNSTGNAGMATAGSGDVLTGIITGLLAQGYDPIASSILGVYLHGLAGDLAAEELSMEAMIAGDIISHIGEAYLQIISG